MATVGEQVKLIYSETVAEDAKFILQVQNCPLNQPFPALANNFFYEVYGVDGTKETVRFDQNDDV